jgi:hypothetical protein
MKITLGGVAFEHHNYDPRGDVLYLNVGERRPAVQSRAIVLFAW